MVKYYKELIIIIVKKKLKILILNLHANKNVKIMLVIGLVGFRYDIKTVNALFKHC